MKQVIRRAMSSQKKVPNKHLSDIVSRVEKKYGIDSAALDDEALGWVSAALYNWRFFIDETSSNYLYENLISKYENIFMAFCGHVASDDALVRYDVGVNGNTVTSMLINLQASLHDNELGEDPVFMIKVNESKKSMRCYYYSPANDAVYNLQNQFEIPLYA